LIFLHNLAKWQTLCDGSLLLGRLERYRHCIGLFGLTATLKDSQNGYEAAV
jgi:hypothetical protein